MSPPTSSKSVILFVAANPANRPPLNSDLEQQEIQEALEWTDRDEKFRFEVTTAARVTSLRRAIRSKQPTIVHFSGHGEVDGVYLEDNNRQAKLVEARALRDFFAQYPSIECVVLNACFTDDQAAILAEKIPYVIGMKAEVGSDAAICFAKAFYETVGSADPYEKAYNSGAVALQMEGLIVNAAPIFKLRPAVPVVQPAAPHQALLPLEWVAVDAQDPFVMGSDPAQDPSAQPEEMPQDPVALGAYAISKYPVTNNQYARFVMATPHPPPEHFQNGRVPPGKENHPVVNVSWNDAAAYCKWLSRTTSQQVRLPTEAEWEKAARGGDRRLWPWGNDEPLSGGAAPQRCNFNDPMGDTTPADHYPAGASPYGVMDMAGNVREWTSTQWGVDPTTAQYSYPYAADEREAANAPGAFRIMRGGNYGVEAPLVRCASRTSAAPDYRSAYAGFRLVRDSQ
jgi:serine/threonine-protein kinase